MQFPASTGQVARALGITEPRLNDLLRRGKISLLPPVASGRRLWGREHIQAAEAQLGIDIEDLLMKKEGCDDKT